MHDLWFEQTCIRIVKGGRLSWVWPRGSRVWNCKRICISSYSLLFAIIKSRSYSNLFDWNWLVHLQIDLRMKLWRSTVNSAYGNITDFLSFLNIWIQNRFFLKIILNKRYMRNNLIIPKWYWTLNITLSFVFLACTMWPSDHVINFYMNCMNYNV